MKKKRDDRKAAKPDLKPGQKVPDSGIYRENDSQRRATMVKGEPAPPTGESGHTWRQTVDTNPDD